MESAQLQVLVSIGRNKVFIVKLVVVPILNVGGTLM